jgi:UDP-N-acetylglucosamine--N-acetylmuramyl-(pentapeptide) pyrophosphoryl-undecaprenol N-acetylglucosamine transferase
VRVLLAGGGSGGSATPLLAVAEELRSRPPGVELLYVGTRDGLEGGLAAADGIPYVGVAAGKLRRYWSRDNFTDLFRIQAGVVQSLGVVRRFRPTVAFGAGGFASVPPLVAAAVLRVPVLIHQQDVIPGLANRLLAPFAHRITVAVPTTVARFPQRRARLRGNPVRPRVLAADPARAESMLGLASDVPLVLVTGGGTGALNLNRIVAEAAPALVDFCQVFHLSGRGRGVPTPPLGPRYQQREFLIDEMPHAMAASSIVVTRAGMGTLSELSALGRPAVVVPMPRSHQEANAAAFAAQGACQVVDELGLTARSLVETVRSLLEDGDRRASLADAMASAMPRDATQKVADEIVALASGAPRPP